MVTRRDAILGLAACAVPGPLWAQSIKAEDLGLVPNSDQDQTETLQAALRQAVERGRRLVLPPGRYITGEIDLPSGAVVEGIAGQTTLVLGQGEVIFSGQSAHGLRIGGVRFEGRGGAVATSDAGLVSLHACSDFRIEDCAFDRAASQGISLYRSGGRITGSRFAGAYMAAISSRDGTGLLITGNDIRDCANLGIYLDRGEQGFDGSIIAQNRISGIGWAEGGNGQNGNGINAFRTGGVVIEGNVIDDCAFSAVRLNATRNAIVRGNQCHNLQEVAIFSEFEYDGSIIADNIVDEAAQGIAITNLDTGGHLATCSGNIVRNIWPASPTNPDTTPVGIGVEADTIVSGNIVENVEGGQGIALGWGPYMRNVSAQGNQVFRADIGISVSTVDGTGIAVVTDNMISDCRLAVAGMAWDQATAPDLRDAQADYPNITLSGNVIT